MRHHVDYVLARRATLADYRRGVLTRLDVCDAHPELVRAATYVGTDTDRECPICESRKVKLVSYVYGDDLKGANGRCIATPEELEKIRSGSDEFACYVVEVCIECKWNHLDRRYLLGRSHSA